MILQNTTIDGTYSVLCLSKIVVNLMILDFSNVLRFWWSEEYVFGKFFLSTTEKIATVLLESILLIKKTSLLRLGFKSIFYYDVVNIFNEIAIFQKTVFLKCSNFVKNFINLKLWGMYASYASHFYPIF